MAAHDIPDTPAVRAAMAEADAAGLAALGLQKGHVEAWEDGCRSASDPASTFEWWYFDCQLHDGSTLVVVFSNKPHTDPSGPLTPAVLVIRQLPDGTRRHVEPSFPVADYASSTTQCDVRIGPSTVRGDLAHYDLHVEVDGLTADIAIDRVAPSWRPGPGVTYFDQAKTGYFAWVVPVPYGTVTATLTEAGATTTLTGSAYHDHNWGNHPMNAYLDHWYWGRAHVADYTVVYVRMTTKGLLGFGALNLPTFFLAKGDRLVTDDLLPLRLETTGEVSGPGHQTYPSRLDWTWSSDRGTVTLAVSNPTLIEALDMPTPHHGLGRLVHAFDHPEYYDFNADLALDIRLDDLTDSVTGRTLYEKMMFR